MKKTVNFDDRYGSIPYDNFEIQEFDEYDDESFGHPDKRRWSVLEKLDNRYYCRIRSCYDCFRILNFKCLLAFGMLVSFFLMVLTFFKAIIFNSAITPGYYDFIVIGGGAAGSVVVNRLIEQGAHVLLLEAGSATQYENGGSDYFSEKISRYDIPLFWSSVSQNHESNWVGFNIPNILQTKGLGGNGIQSAMVYMRALASDISKWNIPGWTWDIMLDKYRQLETFLPYNHTNPANTNNEIPWYHGSRGYITTNAYNYIDSIGNAFISSAIQSGLIYKHDFNDPETSREGVGYYHVNILNGIRDSAAKAFISPLLITLLNVMNDANNENKQNTKYVSKNNVNTKNNLDIQLNSVVQQVLLQKVATYIGRNGDPISYKAIGVEYIQHGVSYTAYLKHGINSYSKKAFEWDDLRCVVLSAGAIMTPKILMNSGIGPRNILEKAKIPVKVDNNEVGKQLQDHPTIGMIFSMNTSYDAGYPTLYEMGTYWNQYMNTLYKSRITTTTTTTSDNSNSGSTSGVNTNSKILSSDYGLMGSNGFTTGGFLKSPYSNDSVDLQITVYPTVMDPHIRNKYSGIVSENNILITISLLNPDATYELSLNTTNPFEEMPLFHVPFTSNSQYLSEEDVIKLMWGIQRIREIIQLVPMNGIIHDELIPGRKIEEDTSDLKNWIHNNVVPSSNWVGSARMGTSLVTSVVDEKLHVHGVQSLVIADASVIPKVPNGNVHATVLAVASMASDFILNTN